MKTPILKKKIRVIIYTLGISLIRLRCHQCFICTDFAVVIKTLNFVS